MTQKSVRLFHWQAEEAKKRIGQLEAADYEVTFQMPGKDKEGYRTLQGAAPDAFVIDLSGAISQARDIAIFFRRQKSTRSVPIVFTEGTADNVATVKKILPDAVYTTWRRVHSAIKSALANSVQNPVVPDSNMAGYSGTPLPKKLGIKENSIVCLVGAPPDFHETLGELPAGVKLKRQARGPCDLVLWFTKARKDLESRIVQMGKLMGSGNLWIMWPKKASGVKTDVSEAVVRETGLANGLVDFKICAVDQTWSGLRFARRKTTT